VTAQDGRESALAASVQPPLSPRDALDDDERRGGGDGSRVSSRADLEPARKGNQAARGERNGRSRWLGEGGER